MRRPLAVLVVAALVATLVGCSPPTDPSWSPTPWPTAAVNRTSVPEPLAAADIPNLTGWRIRNDAVGIQARWMQLPGDAPINARATKIVRDAIDGRAAASKTAYTPTVFAPGAGLGDRACVRGSTQRPAAELLADPALGPAGGTGTAVVCDVVAASGTFFGQRLRVVSGSGGAVTADTTTVLYTDTATGEVVTGDALWADGAPAAVWSDLVDAVRRARGSLSLAPVQSPDEATLAALRAAMAQTELAPDGSFVITIGPGFTAPELTELGIPATTLPTTLAVHPRVAASLTTPFGAALLAAASEPYRSPAPVAAGFETIDCTLVPCIGLTYDDGPGPMTSGILDALAAHHAAATFFVVGEKVAPNAALVSRAVAEGHVVENHTWNHPHLTTLTSAQVTLQIRDTTAAITAAIGQTPTVFRPPYGQYTSSVLTAAGMPAILWDVDSFDWTGTANDALIARVVSLPLPGSIVLQHDIQPNTASTVDGVYTGLADRGFVLVNLRQLFGGTLPTSGVWKNAPR